MKNFALSCIKFYQNYISKILPKSCRYYPTCSEYAVWEFKNNDIFSALLATLARILRCNQLFKGGIDYPVIRKRFGSFSIFKRMEFSNIDFWFVPCKNSKFYVIKVLDSLKEKR
ncbi:MULTISPECIES: membrane protein insertion efficiency factor YidD [Campylobacter]|uniref:Putative membrane protein insertion efficiency factor n=1 Tax=Campylobacter curvus (strain 525.92) TaxID=360105 RepID=YIDD_CAMC5|nr:MULTISPECIES: membrane protein insertion efficiency factor YidD [Campylobacter]A7GYZ4.1 RecName: Full=Putative membrane protein insertion efficiency factor [Campylobacter curvus 525.92]EAU00277.1 membrane protein insertion efficiency factor, YidD family [Campylobacter curvus 525.92]EJP74423.1 YidD family protein [Campylobacter sp. FOBRC14]